MANSFLQLFGSFAGTLDGEPELAARFLGMADTVLANMVAGLHTTDQFEVDRYISTMVEQLGEASFKEERAAGRMMSPEEVMAVVNEISEANSQSMTG